MLVFVLLKFTGESVLPEPAAPSGNVGQQLMEQVTIPCVVFLHRGINLESDKSWVKPHDVILLFGDRHNFHVSFTPVMLYP